MSLADNEIKLVKNVSDDFLAAHLFPDLKSKLQTTTPNGNVWSWNVSEHFATEIISSSHLNSLTLKERFINRCRKEFNDLTLLQTQFICAIRHGDEETVSDILNDEEAKLHVINFDYPAACNPLTHAIDCNRIEIVDILSKQAGKLFTLAMFNKLAANGYEDIILTKLQSDALQDKSKYVKEVILGASTGGQKELLVALHERFEDIFAALIQQAFLLAAQQSRYACARTIKFLLAQGANINEGYSHENAAKAIPAVFHCQSLDILKYLLEQGANSNVKAEVYGTPLSYALTQKHFSDECNSIEYIKLLVLHGAYPKLKMRNSTLFELASKEQRKAINQASLAYKAKELLYSYQTNSVRAALSNAVPSVADKMTGFDNKDIQVFFQLLAAVNDEKGNPAFTKDSLSVLQEEVYKHLEKKQHHWSFRLFITLITSIFIIPLFFTLPWLFRKNKLYQREIVENEFNLEAKKKQAIKKLLNNDKITLPHNERPFFKADGSLRKIELSSPRNILMTSKQAKKYDVLRAAAKQVQLNRKDLTGEEADYFRPRYIAAKA